MAASNNTDHAVAKAVAVGGGAVAGGLVVAPIVIGTLTALGLAFPPALPIVGLLTLGGMWVGHKLTPPS